VYLPLEQGTTWLYETESGGAERKTVDGAVDIFGETAQVIRYSESASNEGLENYWTTDAAGDVYLWGFFRPEEGGWGYLYQPPLLCADAPLYTGKSWQTESLVYSLPDTIPASSFVYTGTVTWDGVLAVPAGSFQSFLVEGSTGGQEQAEGFSPDGRLLAGRVTTCEWYSDGVGVVQYGRAGAPSPFQLVDYGVTPVEAGTWTAIKSLFDH
jgi:hypothetical protein